MIYWDLTSFEIYKNLLKYRSKESIRAKLQEVLIEISNIEGHKRCGYSYDPREFLVLKDKQHLIDKKLQDLSARAYAMYVYGH